MNTIINQDSMEDDDAALPEVSDELAASGEQETQEYGGNFVDIPEEFPKKMKVAELNNGQTVWTEQLTNFDPATFAAVWHILGLNIGGSSKKATGILPNGTTIVFGTDCDFVKAWVNNQNIRNILHFSDMSNLSDVSFDIDVRLSRSNEPTNTQPVLLGGAYALISEQDANLVALDLLDGGATEWMLQTRTAHLAMPIVVNDDEAGQWVIYDLSQAGILRQFLVDYTNPSAATLSYAANCVGFINATSVGNNNNNNLVEYTSVVSPWQWPILLSRPMAK